MQCYVSARDSRLEGLEGKHTHVQTREHEITDSMVGKIRLIARETLTVAIAAELSGEDLQGQFRRRIEQLLADDSRPVRIICDFMLSWAKSVTPVLHPNKSKSKRCPRSRDKKSTG